MPLDLVRFRPNSSDVTGATLHWRNIVAGSALILGFGLIALLFGNAIGLNASNTFRADVSGGLKFWSWLYMAASLIAVNYFGTFLTTRSITINSPSSGMIHGLVSWAIAAVSFVGIGSLATVGMRFLLAGVGANSVNWLALCVAVFGACAAAFGGMSGKTAALPQSTEERTRRIA